MSPVKTENKQILDIATNSKPESVLSDTLGLLIISLQRNAYIIIKLINTI